MEFCSFEAVILVSDLSLTLNVKNGIWNKVISLLK